MSGTNPSAWSYERYLGAKATVDDRGLNRNVIDALRVNLSHRVSGAPFRVVEIGGGTGTMVRRAIEWGLLSDAEYTLIDADEGLLAKGLESLRGWASGTGLAVEASGTGTLRLRRTDGSLDLRVRAQAAEVFDFVSATRDAVADLLVANAFLDLVELPRVLPQLLKLLTPGGLFWFPINFDGETIFEPSHPLDGPLMAAYHRTMDERMRAGRPAGDSRTGRKLIHAIGQAGGRVEAAGSSDWVVFAHEGTYADDEAYFLHCILATIDEALSQRPEVNQESLQAWLRDRRMQLKEGSLVYIAHQIDVAGRVR